MRVTLRTADHLVVEEPADNVLGLALAIGGAVAIVVGAAIASSMVALLAGIALVAAGLKIALFSESVAHRFDRRRATAEVEWKVRRAVSRRLLAFSEIAEIELEQISRTGNPGGVRPGPRYRLVYVLTSGERVPWSRFHTSSREDKMACLDAAREFLKLGAAAAARTGSDGTRTGGATTDG